jgi:F0F1-type ATP synthase assembly protein I
MEQISADSALGAAIRCHKVGMLAAVELAGAGGMLVGVTAACGLLGALAGWALGGTGLGLVVGLIVGIPMGILAVYRRYRSFFT